MRWVLHLRQIGHVSDRLACKLLLKSLRRGQYVPFSFERSMWTVIAVHEILKAGDAMVPKI